MFGPNDWIVEPKFFKEYLSKGPRCANAAAFQTRSMPVERRIAARRTAHAFAWKI